jgi:hypothetical protein
MVANREDAKHPSPEIAPARIPERRNVIHRSQWPLGAPVDRQHATAHHRTEEGTGHLLPGDGFPVGIAESKRNHDIPPQADWAGR